MKSKYFLIVSVAIIMGFLFGKFYSLLYKNDSVSVFREDTELYFICLGVEKEKEDNQFVYELKSDGYHIYSGIASDLDIANQIKELYDKDYNNVSIEKNYIDNSSFISMLNEYEKIVRIASLDTILDIEKTILSNYKEMVLINESND